MNIDKNKKKAIIILSNKGESLETLQILTGLSKDTIEGIIRSSINEKASKRELLLEWDAIRMSILGLKSRSS